MEAGEDDLSGMICAAEDEIPGAFGIIILYHSDYPAPLQRRMPVISQHSRIGFRTSVTSVSFFKGGI